MNISILIFFWDQKRYSLLKEISVKQVVLVLLISTKNAFKNTNVDFFYTKVNLAWSHSTLWINSKWFEKIACSLIHTLSLSLAMGHISSIILHHFLSFDNSCSFYDLCSTIHLVKLIQYVIYFFFLLLLSASFFKAREILLKLSY